MKMPFLRYNAGIVSQLFLYWSLSFTTEYLLNKHPLSADAWQGIRLLALLVTASLVITAGRLFVLDASVRQETAQVMLLVMLILHVLALLLPSVWLFYQWQWDGQCLLQWQGGAFSFSLVVLPAVVFIYSSW
ncbi:hypothetical protein ABVL59_004576 [Salmonella enterica]|uniref:Uncharacterized protein n=1 Tax=Salmonella enterica TaxID=28901 RepID=A0A760BDQ4_SALER|nr:hypothetical protein [Salmonella enterica]EBP3183446.1 hypothetical protein [Salmonella enterica]EDO2095617.1 hypothetical protein [Salmonella enterica]EDS8697055.1 hypothetical protein [Salmonella enterica]EEL0575297.1 hypothetical protein [Salmonella enterica]